MPKASEVASELRKLADGLDREPDMEVDDPYVSFYNGSNKQKFLGTIRALPRPLVKEYEDGAYGEVKVVYKSSAITIKCSVMRSVVCKVVKPAETIPAVYECEPLLSLEDDAKIDDEVSA